MKIADSCLAFLAAAVLAFAPPGGAAKEIEAPKPAASVNANLELARQLNEAFVQVAEDVSPSVVVITVIQKASPATGVYSGDSSDDESSPFDRIPELRRYRRQMEENPPEPTRGQGSGIIIRKDGYILTNRHVVEDAQKIEVRLKDNRIFKAEVRGVDAPSDVAVIKIDATDLPVARLADSSRTRVGEIAIAIGAPFALDYTVTYGHVSAKERSNIMPLDENGPAMTDQSFIQTDANINPGNSGGPLVNINGEVIGINTLIRGLHTGIGFAIPSNLAREVADKLITDGKFTRAWLGIGIRSLREFPEFRDVVTGVKDGIVVDSIVPNGPAAKSDLHPTDVITAIDGKAVLTAQQLKDEIRGKAVGQDIKLDVYRQDKNQTGKVIKVLVKSGEWEEQNLQADARNDSKPEKGAIAGLGLSVKPLTHDLAEQFNVDMAEGVIVTAVDKKGLAARKDIKPGDIITSINQQPISTLQQFRDIIKTVDTKRGVIVNLITEGIHRFEILKEGSDD